MNNELVHYGILGMKWGVRRYQNLDRTWTEAGKKRYNDGDVAKQTKSHSDSGTKSLKTDAKSENTAKQKAVAFAQRYRTWKIMSLYRANSRANQDRQRLFKEYRRETMRSINNKNAREKASQLKRDMSNVERQTRRNSYNRMRWQSAYARTDRAGSGD